MEIQKMDNVEKMDIEKKIKKCLNIVRGKNFWR